VTKEELQAKQAKQAMSVEIKRADANFREVDVTQKDHDVCHQHGFHFGAVAKFVDINDSSSISLFCDLTPQ